METVIANVSVYYETHGEGKTLFLLPGWGGSARGMAAWLELGLQHRHGWKRIYIDPPGHGGTPAAPGITNQDQIFSIVLALIDQLTGGEQFAILGASYGGYLVRGVIFQRPSLVEGVCLLVPVVIADMPRRNVPPTIILIEEPGIAGEVTPEEIDLFNMMVIRTHTALAELRRQSDQAAASDADFRLKIKQDSHKYSLSWDVDALAEPFARPALIITARQDSVVGYQDAWKIMENYPRASFLVLDRAGHLLEEKNGLIFTLIDEWLDRVETFNQPPLLP